MPLLTRSVVFLCVFAWVYSISINNYESAKEELEEYIKIKKKDINPRFRPLYHVAPPVGWMNDPNGFSYHQGQFHLFYQFYPYDSMPGRMHWGHVSSPDLVHWKQLPTALLPETEQCFSGSALSKDDELILMYTGRVDIDEEPFFNETQYLAFSDDAINFNKYVGNPVIPRSPNGSSDFRDPKIWRHGDEYFVIVGSKTLDERGRVLLYKSKDIINWEFLRVLGESDGSLGYMWECPDFFELNGKYVLLMSPQGVQPAGDRYKNTHQTGYIIGSFNYESNEFLPETDFQEIDFGHDFYAATTTYANGKRYLVAWFSMWDMPHIEDVDGWAGMLTIIRELTLIDNRILMKPITDINNLRDSIIDIKEMTHGQAHEFGQAIEINIEIHLHQKVDLLLDGREGGDQVWIRWIPEVGKVVVDRGSGDVRQVKWTPIGSTTWRIFLDSCSMELFCGEGEVVFSSRVFPLGGWRLTNESPQSLQVRAYNLKRSVPE